MQFGEKLRKLRQDAELSQESLAQKAGMSVGNLRKYEQGMGLPKFGSVVKIAEALGVSCEEFSACEDVRGDDPEKPKKKGGKK